MRTDAISYLLNQIALIFSDRIFITAADNREMLPNRCHDNGLITAFGVFTPYFSGSFVRGQPLLSFFGAKLLSSLIFLCVLSSPVFVSVLLLKSFLKSTFLIFSFYEQNAIRSDTQEIFFVQYLVGFGYKSRIISGFSLSHPD